MNNQSEYFLGLLGQIKLFHWSVKTYAAHVALDKLHSSLSDNIDKFMITMTASSDCSNINSYLQKQNENIKKIRSSLNKATELQNILDEMMGNINQCLYLLNLT